MDGLEEEIVEGLEEEIIDGLDDNEDDRAIALVNGFEGIDVTFPINGDASINELLCKPNKSMDKDDNYSDELNSSDQDYSYDDERP